MENTLYPLQFMPVDTERPWGKEKWLLADLGFIDSEVLSGWLSGNTISELMQTYLEKMVGDDTFEYYGLQFPVSVKLIDFEGATPVFVHPDDTVAEERYDALGRTALWQVLSAEPGACIRLGFRQKVTAGALDAAAQAAGFALTAPETVEGYSDKLIQVMSNSMIQIIFLDGDDNRLFVRKEAGDADISGDYNNYAEENIVTVGEYSVTLKGNNGTVSTAIWMNNSYAYAVSADVPMTVEAMTALVAQVA